MKSILPILFGLFALSFLTAPSVSERVKYNMYKKALRGSSMAPYYVVINVKNLQTGEEKEVCTEAPFIGGAIRMEDCSDGYKHNRERNKKRYFEFNCDQALYNIGYNLYTPEELTNLESNLNVDSLVAEAQQGTLTRITFLRPRAYQRMVAHLLFNRGIMMSRGDYAGNVCTVEPFLHD